jgi:hypothetical protein
VFPAGVTLVRSGLYSGSGPITPTITAVVFGPPGMLSALQVWQAGAGTLDQMTGVSGVPIVAAVDIQ